MKFKPIDMEWAQRYLMVDPAIPSGLRWKVRPPRSRVKAGDPAGSKSAAGYWCVTVQKIKCHRIVWALHHGKDPSQITIDHLDRNKDNNTIGNLQAKGWRSQLLNRRVMGSVPYKFVQKGKAGRFRAGYRQPDGTYVFVGTFKDAFVAHVTVLAHRLENHWI